MASGRTAAAAAARRLHIRPIPRVECHQEPIHEPLIRQAPGDDAASLVVEIALDDAPVVFGVIESRKLADS